MSDTPPQAPPNWIPLVTVILGILGLTGVIVGALLLANWCVCTFYVAAPVAPAFIPQWEIYAPVDWIIGVAIVLLARD